MAYARNNPNALYDVGPNIAGRVSSPARTWIPATASTAGLLLNPNSNLLLVSQNTEILPAYAFGLSFFNFGADQPLTLDLRSFSLSVLLPTDSSGNSTLTAKALVELFRSTPTLDGAPPLARLEIPEGETGDGIVDVPVFQLVELYVNASTFGFVDSQTGVQSDGTVGGTNVRVGFNAAGVSRNNPGPNAAGALRY